jgi:hypothetical protein
MKLSCLLYPTQDVVQETLTNNNFLIFFGLALDVVLRPWEKLLMGLKFTEVGLHSTVSIRVSVQLDSLSARCYSI